MKSSEWGSYPIEMGPFKEELRLGAFSCEGLWKMETSCNKGREPPAGRDSLELWT